MIQVYWLRDDQLHQGGSELLQQWQQQGNGFIWLDLTGEDNQQEKALLKSLGCNSFAIQDAQRERHPPKVEHFDNDTFLLYRGISSVNDDLHIDMLPIAFFIGENYLISLHKQPSLGIRKVQEDKDFSQLIASPIRLLCRILNHSSNFYIDAMLQMEAELVDMEEQMAVQGSDALLMKVIAFRSRLRKLRRVFAYHEKIFASLVKNTEWLGDEASTLIHAVQDVYDKAERLLTLSTLYYDLCSDLSDGYLSLTSHQLNRTMQILTVITAIFVPLSFLAGLYGMNFSYMPELGFHYGYPILLGSMSAIALLLIVIFKKKQWF